MGEELIGVILAEYGIFGIAILITTLLIFAWFTGYIIKLVGNFKWGWVTKKKPPFKDSPLYEHLFFTNAKFKLKFDIPTLTLNTESQVMEQVYRDLLHMNIESLYYACKNIANTHDIDSLTPMEWDALVKDELYRMVASYENKAENWGVPKVITIRYLRWSMTYMELLREFISQISSKGYYGTNTSRTNTLLLIANILIISMIGDISTLVEETKGVFKGVKYRGSVI